MDAADEPLLELRAVMARLRAECPWKAEQTHRSLVRYLLEETHETVEAVDRLEAGEPGALEHLREELGDLLLQVYFHAAVAAEAGGFDIDDVARGITDKMLRRNPHVFGDEAGEPGGPRDAAAVNERWQQIKAAEKSGRTTVDEGVPAGLPALLYADKVLDRLHRAGRDVDLRHGSEDLGERLLALVDEARADGVDPEQALRDAVRRRT
ncbi:XTP/dITP diphosphohydrolase [Nocardioides marinisabuli]|uniref:XTP/dITP diphosphohydrolase n=1 Tax=Nocardioides marinisabuli TaxID=419476 RepID=A0A7Y9F1C3_9ACTN|nr:MazG family protein [Nocardioides marinisabuli]NYD57797.1 XTP/dITP diphosphohydrolase [Nocardioides marinisabuli]